MPTPAPNQQSRRSCDPLMHAPPGLMDKFNRVVQVVNDLKTGMIIPGQIGPSVIPGMWVRVNGNAKDANGNPVYGWVQVYETSPGVWADIPDGLSGSINADGTQSDVMYELNNTSGVPDGIRVFMDFEQAGDGSIDRVFTVTSAGAGIFPVKVSVNNATATGSFTTTCDFTYTITTADLAGTVLSSAAIPEVPRFPNTTYNVPSDGSYGLAFRNSSGDIVLYSIAEEIPATTTITYITAIQIDNATYKIQVKTQECRVFDKGTESGWTDVYTGGPCP